VSCSTISSVELERIIPVKPPRVNRVINPNTHHSEILFLSLLPYNVLNHLKTLIPVGIAIIMVAAVKYARVSRSIPTVNI
jgi:hypothetical protein